MISIIGGGAVGRIVERICQLKGWDHTLFTLPTSPGGGKKILLNAASMQFLEALGFNIPYQRAYSSLKIIQHKTFHHVYIDAKHYPADYLCYSIDAAALQSALEQHSNPTYATITGGEVSPDGFTLATSLGEISTRYLVGCDGHNSITKNITHISSSYRPHHHSLLIPANIDGKLLIQRYGPKFIMGIIPGEDGMIIISSPKSLQDISPTKASLQSLLRHHCYINAIGKRSHHSYQPSLASTCFHKNALILGNAALVVEPIAAQGLNHAISNLKLLYHMPQWQEDLIAQNAKIMQRNNRRLYQHMDYMARTDLISTIAKKLLFSTQIFSPLLQDCIYTFGNRYE